jgi:CheY-like chemotaxis protein
MGGTLLLADDSITIQKVVELTFAETDHTVVAVGSGRELLTRLGEVRPDVVLCDVVMPDMSGYEVCQTLKSGSETLGIPVILLTGTFEPFDRDRALAAGCDAIVTKPFEARELIGTVEELLRRGPASAVGAPPPIEEASELPDVGIPEGVPSLDFTASSLSRSGPAAADVLAAPPPDLPAVELSDTYVTAPPPAPPELSTPGATVADLSVPPAPPAAVPLPDAGEPLPEFDFRFDEQPAPAAAPTRAEPAPLAPAAVAESPFGGDVGRTQKLNIGDLASLFSPKTQPPPRPVDAATTQPVLSAPFGAPPEAAPPAFEPLPEPPPMAPPPAAPEPPVAEAEQRFTGAPEPPATLTAVFNAIVSAPVPAIGAEPEPPPAPPVEPPPAPEPPPVQAAPAAPAATAEAPVAVALSDADVERIARRVLELATPLLEQIAWEVLPDVAETLVRARIAELEAAAESES